ncbi:hypothetical protein P152DRAFT_115747 [Eremomyces bilateralis CBS 781.70]|uniref:Transcription factor hoxa13 n=1 Tax=Eremomyces bilateralis CBS 781.70 TaxID=1392243 RepID=A0A6G1GDW9_9PEZI|nr:uncharacterized protein P152DRAFT_115747 [Eremomyces bilateralis CBS 781.70]KAF1816248.1 hypothetical protein P152DRAFT_115747 [Eremomyces bilateralis CBS 781.70]
MAGQANGHAKRPKNGDSNPSSQLSQLVEKPSARKSRTRPRRSFFGWLFSNVVRITLWYIIITTAFRCPSSPSELNDNSPKICKPYFIARTHTDPYTRPYYDYYISPYAERAQPYVSRFQKHIYTPTSYFVKGKYDVYGAPRVKQAQVYLELEWEKRVKPQMDIAKGAVQEKYDQNLAPHLEKATEVVQPLVENAKLQLSDIYTGSIIPAYKFTLPIAQRAYVQGRDLTVNVALPYFWQAHDFTIVFLNRTVWPQLRVLYGENVEPQLLKITQRLGRYRDTKSILSAADEASPTSLSSAEDAPLADAPIASTPTTGTTTSSSSALPSSSETMSPDDVREKIESDLRTWQGKFAKAADKGAEDLEERVRELTAKQVNNQVEGVGKALIVQLEQTIESSLKKLKSTIKNIVQRLPSDPEEEEIEQACNESVLAIRSAGGSIKERAQAIRSWKANFNRETLDLVQSASDSTLEVIDNIRDLGLQEIGMRWAWMEGVTYKDWSKYHQLKKTFDEWRDEVQSVALQHEGLLRAQSEAEALEDEGMLLAEDAARELLRLKDVARWKAISKDDTDDFSTKSIPPIVIKKAKKATDVAKEAAAGLSNSSSSTAGSLESAASVVTEDLPSSATSLSGEESGSSTSLLSKASEAVVGSEQGSLESASSAASSSLSDSSNSASSMLSAASSNAESAQGSAVSAAKEKVDQVSGAVIGTPAPPLEDASSSASDPASEATESAASATKRVLGGAEAQFVQAREVVLDSPLNDDDATLGEKVQERLEQLSSIVREAIVRPSSTHGAVESATSVASEKFDEGVAAASSILYGTQQGAVESLTSVAAEQYASAVTAASYAIYGTPTPVLQSMMAEASSRYEEALRVASEQYGIAKNRVEQQISGKPQPVHEKMLRSVGDAYSDAVATASSKYSSLFSTSTVQVIYTQKPTAALSSISAVASSQLSHALDIASTQYASATKASGLEPTPVRKQYLADARRRYYDSIGQAHAQFEEFLDSAESIVYGTPTPAYQSFLSHASEAVVGTQTPAYESYISVASANYDSAVAAASSGFSAALDSASSAAGVTSQPPAQSVLDDASSYYSSLTSAAGSSLSQASEQASSQFLGTATGKAEPVASQASQNLEDAVSRASVAIYGTTTPYHQAAISQAGSYAAVATGAAAAQYSSLQALVSELIIGREPDYTESVMNRLSSAYHTDYPAMASVAASMADEAYSQASAAVASAFTPPPIVESIINAAASQMNSAIEAASIQLYGTEKGSFEQATEAASSKYSSASKAASEAIYGTQPGFSDAYQSAVANAASSASSAISVAIYGTPTPTLSGAASVYSSITAVAGSAAAENYGAIRSRLSEAVYGEEQGAFESATNRVSGAVESARARLSKMMEDAKEHALGGAQNVGQMVEDTASTVQERQKDEL